jgi:BlaI family penicillinase repressor
MKNPIRITDAEWQVMTIVWEKAPVAASAVAGALEKKHRWSLATVRTLLRRLATKGALSQRLEGKRYLYLPRISRDECVRRQSESFLDRVLGRTPSATVLQLVGKADLSKEDIQELRRLLKEKEEES